MALLMWDQNVYMPPAGAEARADQLSTLERLSHARLVDPALEGLLKAVRKGLLKVMSKMGIATISSYCGAQIFEAVGLDRELIDRYFGGTPSAVGGVGLQELASEALERHARAYPERHRRSLPVRGQRTSTNARTRKGPRKTVGVSKAKEA